MNKNNYTYKKLGEVATFINGFAFKPESWSDTGIPIIRIQNLNDENALFNYYNGNIDTKYIVVDGDILISWSASLGVYEWNRGKAILNQHIFKVVFDKIDIDKYYLKYSVASKINEMLGHTHGATMKHIVKKDFDNTKIPVPPLATQRKIVAELDCLNNIIAKKRLQLQDYDSLAQALFHQTFGDPVDNDMGWEVKKLGEVCTKITDGTHNPPKFLNSGIPFLLVSNIKNNELTYETKKYISKEDYFNLYESTPINIGDVLYTSVGSYGNPAIVRTERKFMFQRHIILLKPNYDKISNIFLHSFLLSPFGKFQADRIALGVAQKTLNLIAVKKMQIPVPPLPLQQQFAAKIEAIEAQKARIRQSVAEVQTLLNYTMDKYFG